MFIKSHTKKNYRRLRIKLFYIRKYVEIHIQKQFFFPFKFMTLREHPHKPSILAHLPHDVCILSSADDLGRLLKPFTINCLPSASCCPTRPTTMCSLHCPIGKFGLWSPSSIKCDGGKALYASL